MVSTRRKLYLPPPKKIVGGDISDATYSRVPLLRPNDETSGDIDSTHVVSLDGNDIFTKTKQVGAKSNQLETSSEQAIDDATNMVSSKKHVAHPGGHLKSFDVPPRENAHVTNKQGLRNPRRNPREQLPPSTAKGMMTRKRKAQEETELGQSLEEDRSAASRKRVTFADDIVKVEDAKMQAQDSSNGAASKVEDERRGQPSAHELLMIAHGYDNRESYPDDGLSLGFSDDDNEWPTNLDRDLLAQVADSGVGRDIGESPPDLSPFSRQADVTPAELEQAMGLTLEEAMEYTSPSASDPFVQEDVVITIGDETEEEGESTSQRMFSFPFKSDITQLVLEVFPKLEAIKGIPYDDHGCFATGSFHQRSLEGLVPGQYLNDELIALWFHVLSLIGGKDTSDVYVFNSYTYSTLQDYGLRQGSEIVASWLEQKGVAVFEKLFLIVPINYDKHWSLAVICNPGSAGAASQNDYPCAILHMDSCSGMHVSKDILKKLKHLLKALFVRLNGKGIAWESKNVKTCDTEVPQQGARTNDCLLFACLFGAEIFQAARSKRRLSIAHFRRGSTSFFDTDSAFQSFNTDNTVQLRTSFRSMLTKLSAVDSGKATGSNEGQSAEDAIVLEDDEAFLHIATTLNPRKKVTFVTIKSPEREKNGQTLRKGRRKRGAIKKTADGTIFQRFGKLSSTPVRQKISKKFSEKKVPKQKRTNLTKPNGLVQSRDSTARGKLESIATGVEESWVTTITQKNEEGSLYACLSAIAPMHPNGSPSGDCKRQRPLLVYLCPEHTLPLATEMMEASNNLHDVHYVHNATDFKFALRASKFKKKAKRDRSHLPSSVVKRPRTKKKKTVIKKEPLSHL